MDHEPLKSSLGEGMKKSRALLPFLPLLLACQKQVVDTSSGVETGEADLPTAIAYCLDEEICGDRQDNDCDGEVDEPEAGNAKTWYPDRDGDGFGDPDDTGLVQCGPPRNFVDNNQDCDDSEATQYPGATAICNDGLINDCDQEEEGEKECRLREEIAVADVEGVVQFYSPGCDLKPVIAINDRRAVVVSELCRRAYLLTEPFSSYTGVINLETDDSVVRIGLPDSSETTYTVDPVLTRNHVWIRINDTIELFDENGVRITKTKTLLPIMDFTEIQDKAEALMQSGTERKSALYHLAYPTDEVPEIKMWSHSDAFSSESKSGLTEIEDMNGDGTRDLAFAEAKQGAFAINGGTVEIWDGACAREQNDPYHFCWLHTFKGAEGTLLGTSVTSASSQGNAELLLGGNNTVALHTSFSDISQAEFTGYGCTLGLKEFTTLADLDGDGYSDLILGAEEEGCNPQVFYGPLKGSYTVIPGSSGDARLTVNGENAKFAREEGDNGALVLFPTGERDRIWVLTTPFY